MTTDDDKPDRVYVDHYHQDLTNVVHARQDDLQTAYADLGWPYDYWWLETWATNTLIETWQIGQPGQETVGSTFKSDNYYFASEPPEDLWSTSCAGAASWPAATTPDASVVTSSGPESCGGQALPGMAPQFLPMATWEYCNVTTSSQTGQYTTYFYVDPTTGEWLKNVEADEFQYKRHANASIKYYSGGKAVSGRQNLISFGASATQVTNQLDQPPYSGYTGPPIPPGNIKLGDLGWLGNDGLLYKALSDSVTVVITPTVTGNSFYTFNVSAIKHKLHVFANGLPLAYDHVRPGANYCVGQYMAFSPGFSPSIGGIQNTTYLWALGGKFVNALSYAESSGGLVGSFIYFVTNSLLQQEDTHAWWVSGGSGAPATNSATIAEDITFDNGQSVLVSGKGMFTVYKPSVSPLQILPPPPAVSLWSSESIVSLTQLGLNANASTAMLVQPYITSQYSGTAVWTQLVNGSAVALQSYDTLGSNELDTAEYYPYPNTETTVITNVPIPVPLVDAPHVTCYPSPTKLQDAFTDYLRFKPDAGDPSQNIFITLGVVTWGVNGTAENTSSGWVLDPNSSVTQPTLNPSDVFPYWIYTLSF